MNAEQKLEMIESELKREFKELIITRKRLMEKRTQALPEAREIYDCAIHDTITETNLLEEILDLF